MQIVFALVALVVGFVLLVKGADWFVEGSAGIANKFGIPQIVIGLTIVAMGTTCLRRRSVFRRRCVAVRKSRSGM